MDEPLIDQILDKSELIFGPGDYTCAMILPYHVEAALIGALKKDILNASNLPLESFASIEGIYNVKIDGLTLYLKSGVIRGICKLVNLDINLNIPRFLGTKL